VTHYSRPTALFSFLVFICFFCQAQDEVTISSLTFEGNRITRERILLREVTFREGQSIARESLPYHLERSKGNLWNLLLFNFVEIDTCHYSANEIDVVVRVTERWYVWPIPFVEFADRNLREWWETKRWDRLDYGTLVRWSNFRGLKEELTLHLRFGFNNRYELRYEIPYLDKAQKWGIEFKGGYEQSHEVAFATVNNKRVFFKNSKSHIRKESYGAITPRWRPNLYNLHKLEVGYTHAWVHDSVAKLQPAYFGAGENVSRYFSIEYEVMRDVTDYTDYPTKGYRIEFKLRKDGLRIMDSPVDIWTIEFEYAKYWQIHNRWYFAHAQKIKASSTNGQAYSLQEGLGYERNFVRGYELYVVDGQHYGLLKTALKWAILPMRKVKLKFLRSEKFNTLPLAIYISANFDMGFVMDNQFNVGNPLAGSLLLGGGMGIDLVTFYDISWRAEYSVNKNLEHGFFLHFTKHI
jgi:outer membrane protein assembly factor BamA